MILKVIFVIAAALAILALYIAFKIPKNLPIQRSRLIAAPAAKLFPYINNLHLLQQWNPFVDGDETVKINYAGPEEGVGAQFTWEGKSGIGRLTILESQLNAHVGVRLDFQKPFHVTNSGEYNLLSQGESTQVTWIINESAFIARLMSVFIDLDKLVGGQFEKGLIKLETLVTAAK